MLKPKVEYLNVCVNKVGMRNGNNMTFKMESCVYIVLIYLSNMYK